MTIAFDLGHKATTQTNTHQYVSLLKSPNFDAIKIERFTVTKSHDSSLMLLFFSVDWMKANVTLVQMEAHGQVIINYILQLPGPKVIKHFSCSTQLSMKFQLPIKTKILKNKDCSCFKTQRCCIYPANKC